MGRRRVQEKDILEMNELYLEIGTFAGVARATGWSASTVSKYVKKDYQPKEDIVIPKRSFIIEDKENLSKPINWREYLNLSDAELKGTKELQKTIGGI